MARNGSQSIPLSPLDLAGANLEAFLFAVEHTGWGWELRVECATDDGWQAQTILLGNELAAAAHEADAHAQGAPLALLEERLVACSTPMWTPVA